MEKRAPRPGYQRRWRKRNKLRLKTWRANNSERIYFHGIKHRYGLTGETYKAMLKEQGGVCALCKMPPGRFRLCVDHCHKTGKVRSLLCGKCNSVIGWLETKQIDATAYISGNYSMSKPNEGDGKFVVVENGQRVSDLHSDQAAALKEAESRKKLSENQGDKAPTVEVKQNLFG